MAVSSSLALVLLLTLVSYICIGALVNQRKLSAFKGPPLAAYSRFWLWRQSVRQRVHIAEKEALEKYGMSASSATAISSLVNAAASRLARAHRA